VPLTRRRNGRFDRLGICHIAADREPADLVRRGGRRRLVDIQDGDLDTGRSERLRRRPAEAGGSAADDSCLPFDLLAILPS